LKFSQINELELKQHQNEIFQITDEVMLAKEKRLAESSAKASTDEPQVFIDYLYKKRDLFSFKEIHDEINTAVASVRNLKV
jgi:hypothetical protein